MNQLEPIATLQTVHLGKLKNFKLSNNKNPKNNYSTTHVYYFRAIFLKFDSL